MSYCVYALVDPRTDDVFYIGHTGDFRVRTLQHIEGTDQLSGLFVKQMSMDGHAPSAIVLERMATLREALSAEVFWIEMFLARGAVLLNAQGAGGAVETKRVRRKLTKGLDDLEGLRSVANGRPANGFNAWTSRDVARLKGMQRARYSPEAMADALERPVVDIQAQLGRLKV